MLEPITTKFAKSPTGFGKRKDARRDVKLSTGSKLRRYGWKNIAQKMGLKKGRSVHTFKEK